MLLEGFGGVPGKLNSRPPSHLTSAVDQMINFLGVLQNEWAGAMAYNSFDTFLAPYVKIENLSKQTVKQCMENFIYGVNVTSRWGQSPFVNITLDLTIPKDLAKDPVIIAGKEVGFTYGDCQAEVDLINEAFWEVMLEGDASNLPFTFPIPTVNITKDFDWDSKIANLIFEVAGKYGLPYFNNFISSDLDPSDVRSMCPLPESTLVIVQGTNGTYRTTIKGCNSVHDLKVLCPDGQFRKGKWNVTGKQDIYKVTLANGLSFSVGEHHLCPTNTITVSAKDLTTDDYIPLSLTGYETFFNLGEYSLGRLVGLYVAEGSKYIGTSGTKNITYSLNPKTDGDYIHFLTQEWNRLGYSVWSTVAGTIKNYTIYGDVPYSIISEYVEGASSTTKRLSAKVFGMSKAFREGLLCGWTDGDGSRQASYDCIYTSSPTLRTDLIDLLASIGRVGNTNHIHTYPNGTAISGKTYGASDNYQVRVYRFTNEGKVKTRTKGRYFLNTEKTLA